jgi:CRP/FNR family transcriptional regulator, cyclic AMP receptor protein
MKKVLFLFGEMNDLDIDWLISQGTTQRVSKGTVLIEEGARIRALYIVMDGLFEVSVAGRGRGEIGRMGAGEILGEISFVDSRPPSTTVQALTDSVVFSMSRERLSAKLKEHPEFAARFYRALAVFLSHRLRVLTLKFSERLGAVASPTSESAGELDPEVLSGVYLAGRRFERMLKRLTGN